MPTQKFRYNRADSIIVTVVQDGRARRLTVTAEDVFTCEKHNWAANSPLFDLVQNTPKPENQEDAESIWTTLLEKSLGDARALFEDNTGLETKHRWLSLHAAFEEWSGFEVGRESDPAPASGVDEDPIPASEVQHMIEAAEIVAAVNEEFSSSATASDDLNVLIDPVAADGEGEGATGEGEPS